MEHYKTIYSWKVLNGLVLNCNMTWSYSESCGSLFSTLRVKKHYKGHRIQSFQYCGPRYFNILPRYLRDSQVSLEEWKALFNDFLRKIPDQSEIGGLMPEVCDVNTAKPSNSLLNWIPFMGLNDRIGHDEDLLQVL